MKTDKKRKSPLTLEETMNLKAQRMRDTHEHFKNTELNSTKKKEK